MAGQHQPESQEFLCLQGNPPVTFGFLLPWDLSGNRNKCEPGDFWKVEGACFSPGVCCGFIHLAVGMRGEGKEESLSGTHLALQINKLKSADWNPGMPLALWLSSVHQGCGL